MEFIQASTFPGQSTRNLTWEFISLAGEPTGRLAFDFHGFEFVTHPCFFQMFTRCLPSWGIRAAPCATTASFAFTLTFHPQTLETLQEFALDLILLLGSFLSRFHSLFGSLFGSLLGSLHLLFLLQLALLLD